MVTANKIVEKLKRLEELIQDQTMELSKDLKNEADHIKFMESNLKRLLNANEKLRRARDLSIMSRKYSADRSMPSSRSFSINSKARRLISPDKLRRKAGYEDRERKLGTLRFRANNAEFRINSNGRQCHRSNSGENLRGLSIPKTSDREKMRLNGVDIRGSLHTKIKTNNFNYLIQAKDSAPVTDQPSESLKVDTDIPSKPSIVAGVRFEDLKISGLCSTSQNREESSSRPPDLPIDKSTKRKVFLAKTQSRKRTRPGHCKNLSSYIASHRPAADPFRNITPINQSNRLASKTDRRRENPFKRLSRQQINQSQEQVSLHTRRALEPEFYATERYRSGNNEERSVRGPNRSRNKLSTIDFFRKDRVKSRYNDITFYEESCSLLKKINKKRNCSIHRKTSLVETSTQWSEQIASRITSNRKKSKANLRCNGIPRSKPSNHSFTKTSRKRGLLMTKCSQKLLRERKSSFMSAAGFLGSRTQRKELSSKKLKQMVDLKINVKGEYSKESGTFLGTGRAHTFARRESACDANCLSSKAAETASSKYDSIKNFEGRGIMGESAVLCARKDVTSMRTLGQTCDESDSDPDFGMNKKLAGAGFGGGAAGGAVEGGLMTARERFDEMGVRNQELTERNFGGLDGLEEAGKELRRISEELKKLNQGCNFMMESAE